MRGRSVWSVTTPALALLALAAAAGCSAAAGGKTGSASAPATSPAVTCGTARTAAGVPVDIEISRGSASCALALSVERGYTRAVASGRVKGNGGGAPVAVKGWVCQGFNTPQVLATGDTSACRRGGVEILAVLPSPAAGTPSP